MKNFPIPEELVEEVQHTQTYSMNQAFRQQGGGQFVITLEGEGELILNGVIYPLPPGTGFLALHSDPKIIYRYPPKAREPWRFLWVSLANTTSEKMISEFVKRYGYIYHLPLQKGIVRQLLAYKSYRNSIYGMSPLPAAKLVTGLFANLSAEHEEEEEKDPQNNLIRKAREYIFENMQKDISVEDISENLKISREHLSRIFSQQTGISPASYIRKKKIRFACHFLRETNLSCKQVATRLGYRNISSFSRTFKKIIHLTPGKYREIGYIPKSDTTNPS
ncbi:MAG: AraC family transcriptional regulator [Verrucomicrobiota bacterium]|nr:AraC family transcriptional regulator [Verrucomicrobiota bacterium]